MLTPIDSSILSHTRVAIQSNLIPIQILVLPFLHFQNGIIHNCAKPNNSSTPTLPEPSVFLEVFSYIETLVTISQPQKLLMIAIDGVAPRAKMNQQRARRFRSAKEMETLRQEGVVLESSFDSNSITPGTVFMERCPSSSLRYSSCPQSLVSVLLAAQ